MGRETRQRPHLGAGFIEETTLLQAERTARLPFVREPLALMPDAHVGIGATVGSVAT